MTNDALQGAKFTLDNDKVGYHYETTIDGRLVLPNIPYGEYTYTISKKGYETIEDTFVIGENQHLVFPVELEKKATKKTTKKTSKE